MPEQATLRPQQGKITDRETCHGQRKRALTPPGRTRSVGRKSRFITGEVFRKEGESTISRERRVDEVGQSAVEALPPRATSFVDDDSPQVRVFSRPTKQKTGISIVIRRHRNQ